MTTAAVSFFYNLPTCLFHFSVPSPSSRISWKEGKTSFEFAFYFSKVKVLVAQSRLTLCDPLDCSPPGSSDHGILQARILEWVAILQGIFPTRGLNPCLLHWQGGSLPLSHQRCPLLLWPEEKCFRKFFVLPNLLTQAWYQGLAREFIHFLCVFLISGKFHVKEKYI